MRIYRLRTIDEYRQHARLMQGEYAARREYEKGLLPRWRKRFRVAGYSYPAGRTVRFYVDYLHQDQPGVPNWRERLICPDTGLNNRMRAAVHLFEAECGPYSHSRLYLSEQVAPLYRYFAAHYANVTGSEFLGEDFAPGSCNPAGIRHEDLIRLSFGDAAFDYFLSFDCFEHIPAYRAAFGESCRVLAPGGTLFFSVPFVPDAEGNLIRARKTANGSIEHLLEPEYHGDPLNSGGCLCFQHFGWEMLNELKETGFRDAYAMLYWSRGFGYLGGEQVLFVARK